MAIGRQTDRVPPARDFAGCGFHLFAISQCHHSADHEALPELCRAPGAIPCGGHLLAEHGFDARRNRVADAVAESNN